MFSILFKNGTPHCLHHQGKHKPLFYTILLRLVTSIYSPHIIPIFDTKTGLWLLRTRLRLVRSPRWFHHMVQRLRMVLPPRTPVSRMHQITVLTLHRQVRSFRKSLSILARFIRSRERRAARSVEDRFPITGHFVLFFLARSGKDIYHQNDRHRKWLYQCLSLSNTFLA